MKKDCVLLLLFISLPLFGIFAQGNTLRQLFLQGEYENCIKESNALLEKNTKDSSAYFFKGVSLIRLKNYAEGEAALQKAGENGYQPLMALNANLLRAYAGQKQTEKLIAFLDQLAGQGFAAQAFLKNTQEFAYLEDNVDYQKVKTKVDKNSYPCRYGAEYKKLDFWLGEWDVFVSGTKTADSKITKGLSGCTLHEDYRTSQGFYGRSINYYDLTDSLYHQIWIAQNNNVTHFKELDAREGYLQMQADRGNGSLSRMAWQYNPDEDSVLQTVESSSDNGQTWSPTFSGLYKRKSVGIKEELDAVLGEMEKLFQENKMAEIAQHYTEDAQMLEPGGAIHAGNLAIKTYWRGLKDKGISWDNELIEAEVSGDLVYSISISNLKHLHKGKEYLSKTKALIIWEKTDKGYKIKKDFFHFLGK